MQKIQTRDGIFSTFTGYKFNKYFPINIHAPYFHKITVCRQSTLFSLSQNYLIIQ